MVRIMALVLATLFSGWAQAQKLTVSVMDLNVTEGLTNKEVLMLTDKLINEFVSQGVYKVIERSKRDEVLKEQGFQQSGACDASSCLVEAGQYLGAQKMFGGTIGKFGTVFAVELRMIDVKTGEIDMSFSREYSGDVSVLLRAMKEAAAEFSKWKPRAVATPMAEARTEYGSIRVQSTPSGAKIFLDGQEVGTTPRLLSRVEVGDHNIVLIKEGYGNFSQTVKVAKNVAVSVSAVLTREYGTLTVTSEPANSIVYIDGVNKGLTSLTGLKVAGLGIGVHQVRVIKAGYDPYEVEMTIERGEGNTLHALLKPKLGSIVITSTPSGALVSIDGSPRGNTPCMVNNLSPGTYQLRVEKEGYEAGQISVTLGPGENVARNVVLKKTFKSPPYTLTGSVQDQGGEKMDGLTYISTNDQGFREYRNEKDGSVLIEIPAGEFIMGSNNGDDDEKPVHTVYLDRYYIGKYEVTLGQFRKFLQATGYHLKAERSGGPYVYLNDIWVQKTDASWDNPYFKQSDNSPVVCVNWNDVKAYCQWAGLRLPTEAEWEKAAKGTPRGSGEIREYPWEGSWDNTRCNSFEKGDSYLFTSPVGSFPMGQSPYGCYDMAGNVWEWCYDWYDEDYYRRPISGQPSGPASGKYRVIRGGSWSNDGKQCRAANRNYSGPDIRYSNVGFRLAR